LQSGHALHGFHHGENLLHGEHRAHGFATVPLGQFVVRAELFLEHLLVEKLQRVERVMNRGRGEFFHRCQEVEIILRTGDFPSFEQRGKFEDRGSVGLAGVAGESRVEGCYLKRGQNIIDGFHRSDYWTQRWA